MLLRREGGSAGQWVGEFCPHCIGLGCPPASVNSLPAANLRRMRGQCGLNSRQQAQLGDDRASANRSARTCRAGDVRDCHGPAALAIAPNFFQRSQAGLKMPGGKGLFLLPCWEGRKRSILCGSHSPRNRCHRQCDSGRSVRRSVAGGIEPCPFTSALPRFGSGE